MEMSRFWMGTKMSGVVTAAVLSGVGMMGVLGSAPALAQDGGVNGHGFGLTAQDGDVRDPLAVERPGKMNGGDWYGSVVFEYADGTMEQVVRDPSDGLIGERAAYLDNLFGANLVGGASVAPFLRFDVRLPVFFSARGFNANDPAGQPIGGGVGMGFSQHSGMVICCDGSEDADWRIANVLWNDPATGVMRHADAGYDAALECAREQGLNLPGILDR